MHKVTLLVAALAVAALPSTADAAKKKVHKRAVAQAPAAQPVNPNEASGRFLRDAVPVLLPTWALPFYLSQQQAGPHAYWYYNGQPQPQPQPQARTVRRVKHASVKRAAQ